MTGAAVTQTSVLAVRGERFELSAEMLAAVRKAARYDAHDVARDASLQTACRRFAQTARHHGVSAARVVIALKRAYHTLVPAATRDRDGQLSRLITMVIESYYDEA